MDQKPLSEPDGLARNDGVGSSRRNGSSASQSSSSSSYHSASKDVQESHDLKTLVQAPSGVLPHEQVISGWSVEPASDDIILADLEMNSPAHLFLVKVPFIISVMSEDDDDYDNISPAVYFESSSHIDYTKVARKLRIFDENKSKYYTLILDSRMTIKSVKQFTFYLTGIAVLDQEWVGWPRSTRDKSRIGNIKLKLPCHNLIVWREYGVLIDITKETEIEPQEVVDEQENSSTENDLPADDSAQSLAPLIADDVQVELDGSLQFNKQYFLRYGRPSPDFLLGSLEDAVNEVRQKPVNEREMLAIFLHHDGSVLSNEFCTKMLRSETVLQMFQKYFSIWGWDVTNEANRNMFLASAMNYLCPDVAETVRHTDTEYFPVLLIVSLNHSYSELIISIYGKICLSDFIATLIHAISTHSENRGNETREEEDRATRKQLKSEQDRAYERSLIMDRAKEEAKRMKLLKQAEDELVRKADIEEETKKRIKERVTVLARLPAEPNLDVKDVVIIKFRTPTGDTFQRRFLSGEKMMTVYDFLLVKGFKMIEFKLLTSWPKKDVSMLEVDTSLSEIILHSQEILIIEERDEPML